MVEEKLNKILKRVVDTEEITNYELYPHIDALRGDGFLGEFYTGEVVNKDTGSVIQIYVKLPPPLHPTLTYQAFYNECRFYSLIFPEFKKFQFEKGVKAAFQNIPKFYCGDNTSIDSSYVALENLKVQDYILFDKTKYINKDHLRTLFEIYGKFHALSFAFKDQNPERYLELTKSLKDVFIQYSKLFKGIKVAFIQGYNAVKNINMEIAEKLKQYTENLEALVNNAFTYKGTYSALTHGDCWSNNMLFKYGHSGTIEDIKLLDFQLCRDSTPIHDLSYFFYSGAYKEDFNNIDEYLELYHKSFSSFAKELGSDPKKLLPINVLKSEWKTNAIFGILMGLMLWQIKLLHKETIKKISVSEDNKSMHESMKLIWESDEFKKNTSDILIHAVEHGIL